MDHGMAQEPNCPSYREGPSENPGRCVWDL